MADKPWDDPSLKPKVPRFIPPGGRKPKKKKKSGSTDAPEILEKLKKRNQKLVDLYGEKKKKKADPKKGAF